MIFGQSSFFDALGIFVIAAALVALVARWLRLPSLVSFIAAGLVIGPLTGLVGEKTTSPEVMGLLGEMGIVLLMFVVGLELSLDRIKEVGKVALAAGLGQVAFTSVLGFGLCRLLGFDSLESLFIATALTFSSTAVVVKLLDQKGELHSLYGQIAVGIFLVQDLVVIVVLTFLAGLGANDSMSPSSIALGLARAFGGMALLLVSCLLGARYLLPRVLGWAARAPRTLFIWSLAWCLGFVVAAHALDLSAEIGAFLAGLSIAQLSFADDLRRRTHPLMTFFMAMFFVSLGAQMQLSDAGAYWLEGVVLSLFVLIGNPVIFIWIIARFGYSERTSFLTSVTVAQISEFSFVFAAMGLSMGLIKQPILSVVGVVGVLTIAISAYMILYNHQLYAFLNRAKVFRIFRIRPGEDTERATLRLHDHVIVQAHDLHRLNEEVEAVKATGALAPAYVVHEAINPAQSRDEKMARLSGYRAANAALEMKGTVKDGRPLPGQSQTTIDGQTTKQNSVESRKAHQTPSGAGKVSARPEPPKRAAPTRTEAQKDSDWAEGFKRVVDAWFD